MEKNSNLFLKMIIVIILVFGIVIIHNNEVVAANNLTYPGYWTLNPTNNPNNGGNRELKIETYVLNKATNQYDRLEYEETLTYNGSRNPGTLTVIPDSKYAVNYMEYYHLDYLFWVIPYWETDIIDNNVISSISLDNNQTEILKIYLEPKITDVEYEIEFIVNGITKKIEQKEYKNYTSGTITVPFIESTDLGLSLTDTLNQATHNGVNIAHNRTNKTITFTPNLSGNNKIQLVYGTTINYEIEYYVNSVLKGTKSQLSYMNYNGGLISVSYNHNIGFNLSSYNIYEAKHDNQLINFDVTGKVVSFTPTTNGINKIQVYFGSTVEYVMHYYINTNSEPIYIENNTKRIEANKANIQIMSNAELMLSNDYKPKNYKIDNSSLIKSTSNVVTIDNPVSTKVYTIKMFLTNGVTAEEALWKRSVEAATNENYSINGSSRKGEVISLTNYDMWKWNATSGYKGAGTIGLSITGENEQAFVWDIARYHDDYVGSRKDRGFPYSTWQRQYSSGRDMRRFQTVITVPEGYDGNDFVRMKSVNQEAYIDINNGNIVPINDNIFVFVYKEGTVINNDNYLNYLAFWGGTETQNNKKVYFNGIEGDNSYQNNASGDIPELDQTDGWHVYATIDNVGEKLLGAKSGDEYVIDIFSQDYAVGGGMDKFEFEFVKNKIPRPNDDVYISAKGETLNLSVGSTNGVMTNDTIFVAEAPAMAKIVVDNVKIKQPDTSKPIYDLYDGAIKAGTITEFNKNTGKFIFTPETNYIGMLNFDYYCYQKDESSIVSDVKANVKIYVLPSIKIKHTQASLNNGNIVPTTNSLPNSTDIVVYGWPSNMEWKDNWTWPEVEIGRSSSDKSSFAISPTVFQSYSYIGYKGLNGQIKTGYDSNNKINLSFSESSNKQMDMYYRQQKGNLVVEAYEKSTNTLLQRLLLRENLYAGQSYTVATNEIPVITGYSYANVREGSLTGSMVDGGKIVKLDYVRNNYKYFVQYYFNDELVKTLQYWAPFDTQINQYLKAEEIDDLKEQVKGYDHVRTENAGLRIKSDQELNVIKVYYERKTSELGNFKMYNPFTLVDIAPNAIESNFLIYNNIFSMFDYTFGFKFTAGKNIPMITLGLDDLGTMTNFRLYKDGVLVKPLGSVKYNSYDDLMRDYTLTHDENYIVTFNLKLDGNKSPVTLSLSANEDLKIPEGVITRLRLYTANRPNVE